MHNKMKKENLIGQTFGRLLVISNNKNILEGKKRNKRATWNCACICGNIIIAKSYHLKNGGVTSCGCYRDEIRIKLKPNQKFGRLTTISYNGDSVWNCLCDCGTYKLVKSNKLKIGATRSCGCLRKESLKVRMVKAINARRKYTPRISSARRIWQQYCRTDKCTTKNPNISFDDFFELSQINCFYCGATPNNKYNLFKYSYYKGSKNAIENGNFIYNGLDRIDNAKLHVKKNCVSCCIICNRAKHTRSLDDMYNYINTLTINSFKPSLKKIKIPNDKILQSIKMIWSKIYKQEGLAIEEFYELSQMPCYYCNKLRSNKCVKKYKNIDNMQKSLYLYNGIDRIDNLKGHTIDNVVPCCKYCNFAKSNLNLEEFQDWIKRIKEYNKNL